MRIKKIRKELLKKNLDEGLRELIFKKFIFPLMKYIGNKSPSLFLSENIFLVHERHILTYRCSKKFAMPGLYRENMGRPVQGVGYRQVHKGAKILVRYDDTAPNRVEIETYIGPGKKESHFLLTDEEYWSIGDFIQASNFAQLKDPGNE